MATVTAMTAARMLAIEAESITGARVDAATFHLILTRHDGTEIDAGDIQGPVGPMNPNAADLSDVNLQTFEGIIASAGLNLGPVGAGLAAPAIASFGGDIHITQGAGKSVVTLNNTLDDGTGNFSVTGFVRGLGNDHWFGVGADGFTNGSFIHVGSLGDPNNAYVVGAGSGTSVNVNLCLRPQGTGDVFAQTHDGGVSNLLCDGAGNMRVAENLFVNTAGSSLCIGGMAGGSNPCIYNDGSGNIMLQTAGAGHAVKTNNNILDDGAGSMTVAGGITTHGSIGVGSNGTLGSYLLSGAGVPSVGVGNNGDFYLRSDGGAGTSIYMKRAGAWVGIV